MARKSIMVLFVALVSISQISCVKEKIIVEHAPPVEIRVLESLPADKQEIAQLRAALLDAESRASLVGPLTSATQKFAEELSAVQMALKAKTAELSVFQQNLQVAKATSVRGTGEIIARMKALEGEQNALQQRFNAKASELIAAAGEKARLEFQLGERTKDLNTEKKFSASLQEDLVLKAGNVALLLAYLQLSIFVLGLVFFIFSAASSKMFFAKASRASS